MNVSVAIQHHPKRAELVQELIAALGESVEIVSDPDPDSTHPSPWRTYRHALETTPPDATHRLILQDDIEPCPHFLDAARLAVAARPHRLLVFFVGGQPREHARSVCAAAAAGLSWAVLDNARWCPAVAVCWPVPMIEPLLTYVDSQRWPAGFRADDEIIGRYLNYSGQTALATAPSLVQHPDVTPSLIGRRTAAGADLGRVAACWIGTECPASSMNWGIGPG